MTDAELTLRAALAAGAQPYDWDTSGDGLFIRRGRAAWLNNGEHEADFDPLNDDGHAFWLAVHVGVQVGNYHQYGRALAIDPRGREYWELGEPGPATRRAVTCAAAGLAP